MARQKFLWEEMNHDHAISWFENKDNNGVLKDIVVVVDNIRFKPLRGDLVALDYTHPLTRGLKSYCLLNEGTGSLARDLCGGTLSVETMPWDVIRNHIRLVYDRLLTDAEFEMLRLTPMCVLYTLRKRGLRRYCPSCGEDLFSWSYRR